MAGPIFENDNLEPTRTIIKQDIAGCNVIIKEGPSL